MNLSRMFALIHEYWSPKIIGALNDSFVKIAKVKGEFIWHKHENEDELSIVVKGKLTIQMRDRSLGLNEGDLAVTPKGVEHRPKAREEVHLLLLEPKTTVNTDIVKNERTVSDAWV